MRRTFILVIAAAALAVTLAALSSTASAQGEEEELGNNLSVPTIFVPSTDGAPALRVPAGPFVPPGADGVEPQNDGGDFAAYWEQKTDATWTADAILWNNARVTADWGDNLTEAPKIKAGHTIRVEMGLLHKRPGMTGFVVENLTPDLPDREATYGTDGTSFLTGAEGALSTRVWDVRGYLKIKKLVDGVAVKTIYSGLMPSELNSIGAVVYGYNWGSMGNPPAAGTYRLVFQTSWRTWITGVADDKATFADHRTNLIVKLV